MKISAVVAVTPNYGIGMSGVLPWIAAGVRLPQEMAYFKKVTSETSSPEFINAVLMGRRTWEGISENFRPLRGRINLVATSNASWAEHLPSGVYQVTGLQHAIDLAASGAFGRIERVVVIGGAQLFEDAMFHPLCDAFHVSFVQQDFECDTFLSPATVSALKALSPYSETAMMTENGIHWNVKIFNPSKSGSDSDDRGTWL